jgi:hypothetical protein
MNTQTQSSKVSKANNGKAKKVIKATQSKASEAKQVSEYKKDVLQVNKALKQECLKFGYSVKVLKQFAPITNKKHIELINLINTDSNIYKQVEKNVRKTKNGNYSAFYLLQYIYSQCK